MVIPSLPETPPQSLVVDAGSVSPLGKRFGFSVESNMDIEARVVALLFTHRPAAIIRRVISVIVNSVNAVPFAGAKSHISNKIFKLRPSLTNFNAAPKVRRVSGMIYRTPDQHPGPYFVFIGFTHAVRALGLAITLRRDLFAKTTARFGQPVSNPLCIYDFFVPALAFAQIVALLMHRWRGHGNDCQPTEFLPHNVNECAHVTSNNIKKIYITLKNCQSKPVPA